MAEEFLNSADVIAAFEEVGSKTVAEGMRGDQLVYFCGEGGLLNGPLEICLVEVVALSDAADRIGGENGRGEDVLPGKFTVGAGIFPFKCIGKVDGTKAPREIKFVLCPDLFEMKAQGFEQSVRKHGDAVVFAFAIADDNLAIGKIEILDAQAHDFHQAQSTAIHDLGHQFADAVHFGDHSFSFVFGQNSGNVSGSGRANGDEGGFVQLDIENVAVQVENSADGLVLGGGRDRFLINKMGDEVVDLCGAHLARMPFIMIQNILPHPGDVGFLGTERIMAVVKALSIPIEQLFTFCRSRWGDRRRR